MTRTYVKRVGKLRDAVRQQSVEELADGTLIRGVIPKTSCQACGVDRLDDGTRCKNCLSLPVAVIRNIQAANVRKASKSTGMPWGDVL